VIVAIDNVSIVVITRNRRDELLGTLPRLLALPDAAEIIVVDNGSDDDTVQAVTAAHPAVRVIALNENRGAAGRNVGVAVASRPYVAFADDDSWWEPGSLAVAARLFAAHPRLAILAGRVVVGADRVTDPTCVAMAASPLPPAGDLPGPSVLGFVACGTVVRVAPFLAVGGFDEMLGVGGEERLLATDMAVAGWGVCYSPDIVAVHMPSPVRDREQRRRRLVRNDLWHVWLRRRRGSAVRATMGVLLASADATVRAGLVDALRALPIVLRRRRAVPAEIDRQLQMVTASPFRSGDGRRRIRGRSRADHVRTAAPREDSRTRHFARSS
jgi:glycosyltransferase involved in cell wall biosynthesis